MEPINAKLVGSGAEVTSGIVNDALIVTGPVVVAPGTTVAHKNGQDMGVSQLRF